MRPASASPGDLAYRCPLCDQIETQRLEAGDACRHCGGPARIRSLPVLMRHLADQPSKRLRENLPALCFSPTDAERRLFQAHFNQLMLATLYGDYGADVVKGVDARDLSRFASDSFCAHISITLFDYFTEQARALNEAWRVLAPGGVFATQILDARVSHDAAAPHVVKKIEKRPGYYDYWPDGVDLASAAVGKDWLVRTMTEAGFEQARHIEVPDPISSYVSHWFVGRKPGPAPKPNRPARPLAAFKMLLRRFGKTGAVTAIESSNACTLCAAPLAAAVANGDCPSCGAPARLRGLPLVWAKIAPQGERFAKPLLGFAMVEAERRILAPYFPTVVSASLHGDYGEGHIAGVDVRDLSRFESGGFSGVFSILLFDYFAEHEQALAEVARVLAPGGVFVTALHPGRVSEGRKPPVAVKTIQSRPGYFDYVPADAPLSSVRVGGAWFAAAMDRAGLVAQRFMFADPLTEQPIPWFVGVKRRGP